jgi:hypothetical protein
MLITFDFYNTGIIISLVSWTAERTDEFDEWWEGLTDQEQRKVVASVEALQELGPSAGRPLADTVEGSKHPNMKELRITPTMRVFFAFDPERTAILLVGGDKAGKTKRFYKKMIPVADRIYDRHLRELTERDGGKEHKDAKDEEKAVQRAGQRGQRAPRRRR